MDGYCCSPFMHSGLPEKSAAAVLELFNITHMIQVVCEQEAKTPRSVSEASGAEVAVTALPSEALGDARVRVEAR